MARERRGSGAGAGALTLNATTANVSIAGILGGANVTQLTNTGGGTVTLTGSSTYTGGTVVDASTLIFSAGASGTRMVAASRADDTECTRSDSLQRQAEAPEPLAGTHSLWANSQYISRARR